jgi:hypothetical protein
MMKSFNLRMLLSLLFVLALFRCTLVWSDIGRIKNKHYFKEGDFVRFHMVDRDFQIYKGYFRGGSQTHLGVISHTQFWALLPNFEAYDKEKNHDLFVKQLGYGRRIWFQIAPSYEARASLDRLFELGKTNGLWNYSNRVGQYDEMKYGLEIYRSNNKTDDDYLYRPEGGLEVYLSCRSPQAKLPSPGCLMQWDYADKVYAEADFSMEYLPIWQDIRADIEKILDGQILNEQGADHGIGNH